VWVRLPLSAVI